MKYNKSSIMKRAWEIRKASNCRVSMSVALKKAWAEAKAPKLPEMTGSQKQIAWANDIRNRIFAALDAEISRFADKAAKTAQQSHKSVYEGKIAALEAGKTYFTRLLSIPYFQDAHNVIERRRHLLNADSAATDALYTDADGWEKKIANWAAL